MIRASWLALLAATALLTAGCGNAPVTAPTIPTGIAPETSAMVEGSRDQSRYQVDGAVTRLVVAGLADTITVTAGPGPVQVSESYVYNSRKPDTQQLRSLGCGPTAQGACQVNYEIRVPAEVAADLHTAAGDVVVTGLSGAL